MIKKKRLKKIAKKLHVSNEFFIFLLFFSSFTIFFYFLFFIFFNSNVDEVIRTILNHFIFVLQEDFTHTHKAQKAKKSIKSLKSIKSVKSIKRVKSRKRQTSNFIPLRYFLCA